MLAIEFLRRGSKRRIYAKSEQLNMTGSIKDCMAYYILRHAYQDGSIAAGHTIVEATSGNTGLSFAAQGRALGHPVTTVMPGWSRERKELLRSLGATVVPVSRDEGGFLGSVAKAEEMAHTRDGFFLPHQFSNCANAEAHQCSASPEIWWQLRQQGVASDAFVAGVGTGGTLMGVGPTFASATRPSAYIRLQHLESPTLTAGHEVGSHRIQGISDEFIPAIVKLDKLDKIVSVSDGDSILMA